MVKVLDQKKLETKHYDKLFLLKKFLIQSVKIVIKSSHLTGEEIQFISLINEAKGSVYGENIL